MSKKSNIANSHTKKTTKNAIGIEAIQDSTPPHGSFPVLFNRILTLFKKYIYLAIILLNSMEFNIAYSTDVKTRYPKPVKNF